MWSLLPLFLLSPFVCNLPASCLEIGLYLLFLAAFLLITISYVFSNDQYSII